MGWAVGWDSRLKRYVGYAVPAYCDHPGCHEKIDRGLSYVCGGDMYGGKHGCGMHFCEAHLMFAIEDGDTLKISRVQLCERCLDEEHPFPPKPDHPRWYLHMATHWSWAEWRRWHLLEKARRTGRADHYARPRTRRRYWEVFARGPRR